MPHYRPTFVALALAAVFPALAQELNTYRIQPGDTPSDIIRQAARIAPTPRQLRWQQLELTAFFHFGINTFTDREWGDGSEDPALFAPTDLDADQWVRTVAAAGFKQVIITAKHHDGFCLWPTATTAHSVAASPWRNGKGDVVRAVADACRAHGIGFGIYLSPWDRNASMYGSEAYNDFFVDQLTELLTGYGTVDEVWFDGANGEGPNGKKQEYDFPRWYSVIRNLQPEAVIAIMGPDVRWVGTETGYGRSTEWSVVPIDHLEQERTAAASQQAVAFRPVGDMTDEDLGSRERIVQAKGLAWYPAETDVSIRPGWFHHPAEDQRVKTPEQLRDIHFASVGRNGVLLLNIPPDTRGKLHPADSTSLMQWASARNATFAVNLLHNASIHAPALRNTATLWDGKPDTYATTAASDTTASIILDLPAPTTFSVCAVQEAITQGQRVEAFTLEREVNGAWMQITAGTTIGHKRLLRFAPVSAQRIRFSITSARLAPCIGELGLYLEQDP